MKIHIKQIYDMVVKPDTRLGDVARICQWLNSSLDEPEECYLCNVGGELVVRRVVG